MKMKDKSKYFTARLRRVVDGDTIEMDVDLGFKIFAVIMLRIAGVDTPEMNSSDMEERIKAKDATLFTQMIVGSMSECLISVSGKGKYGRWIGDVYLNEEANHETLSEALIQNGKGREMKG